MNMFIDNKILIALFTTLISAFVGHLLVLGILKVARLNISKDNGVGMWLGFVERALITIFVLVGLISQTVFIFAVKAAVLSYRLPNDECQRKSLSEYMLFGTMVSYLIALVIGLFGYRYMNLIIK